MKDLYAQEFTAKERKIEEGTVIKVTREQLTNEYGTPYGELVTIFATTYDAADDYIREHLDGPNGKPYYEGRGLWNQLRVNIEILDKQD